MKTNYPTKKFGEVCEINRGQSRAFSPCNQEKVGLPFYQDKRIKNKRNKRGFLSFIFLPLSLQSGYAALTAILLIIFSSLAIIGGLAFFAVQEAGVNRTYGRSVAARAVAEGGIEDAAYRIVSGKQIGASETLAVGSDSTTISVATAGNQRTIRSAGSRANVQQNLETRVDTPVTNAGFHFGAQVGDGGITMGQNASVSGGVFSNGAITGSNGAVITGDAFAAGASKIKKISVSGNAQAHQIEESTVGGYASSTAKLDDVIVAKDAHANELDDTTVNKNAYYNIIDAQSVVLGSRITPTVPPADVVPLALPITQTTIDQWKSDAASRGVIASGACTQDWSPPTNPYTVNGGVLERNLKLDNNTVLILKGTVWVKCNVDVKNGATIHLDAGYGQSSGVLIADGWMKFKNNGAFQGSGSVGSFLLMLTTASGGGDHASAIDLENNAAGAIFYAGNGLTYVNNNVTVTQLTGRTIQLENGATLTYDTGVANINFTAGPSGGYQMEYWKLVP